MIPRRMAWSLLALAAGAGVAGAAEGGGAPRVFHVDAAKGDDAKDGLAPGSAWRSLGRVNGAALRPGDKVLFRRGGAWRGQLVPVSGDASGVVTYGAYGEGEKPLLLGSAAMDRPEDWQPAGPDLWVTAPLRFEPGAPRADLRQARWGLHQEAARRAASSRSPPAAKGTPGAAWSATSRAPRRTTSS